MNIKRASDILKLEDKVSLKKLKKIYRKMVKESHPDISNDPEKILEINEAYKFLLNFIENYEIDLKKAEKEKSLEDITFGRFKNDWLGGYGNE